MISKLTFFLLVLSTCFISSLSRDFKVGGDQGWIVHPSQYYMQWAHQNRFQVGDSLVFKYNKGSDSVLLVQEADFNTCNKNNPVYKWDDGNSVFHFEHSGPFFFISGEGDHCQQGQKLVVVVLYPRTPTPSPAPMAHTPSPAPVAHTPSPVPTAHTPSPAPMAHTPSPAPMAHTPSPAPAQHTPSPAPMADTPSQGPAPAGDGPSSEPPASSPSEPEAPAPAPMSFASSVTPSSVCIFVSTLLASLACSSFMGAI